MKQGKAAPTPSRRSPLLGCHPTHYTQKPLPGVPRSPQLSIQSLDDGGEAAAGLVEVPVAGAEATSQRVLRAERAGGRGLEPGGDSGRRGRGGSAPLLLLSPPLSRCPRGLPRRGQRQCPPEHGHGPGAGRHGGGSGTGGLRPLRPGPARNPPLNPPRAVAGHAAMYGQRRGRAMSGAPGMSAGYRHRAMHGMLGGGGMNAGMGTEKCTEA